jgi:hypothetical protein
VLEPTKASGIKYLEEVSTVPDATRERVAKGVLILAVAEDDHPRCW